MTNSRVKGAAFERRIAKELFDLTGITFRRDLDQYRQRDRGDLLPDDDAWPFLIECKDVNVSGFQTAWWKQANTAAMTHGKKPCVVWKLNRQDIRCRVQLRAAMECISRGRWSAEDEHVIDINLSGLAYLAREGMAS